MAIVTNHLFSALIVLPFLGINSILKGLSILQEPSHMVNYFEDVFVSVFVSNATMLALAMFIERSTAFVIPVLNRKYVTITRAKRICTSITGTCLLCSCILFTGIPQKVFYFVFLPLFILLPSLGFLILPVVGFYGLKRQARKVAVAKERNEIQCLSCPSHNKKEKARRNSQMYRYLFETTRMTITAIATLLFYCVVKFLEYSDVEYTRTSCFVLEHLSFVLLFLPVVVLPVITFTKIPVYWRSARHLWRRRKKIWMTFLEISEHLRWRRRCNDYITAHCLRTGFFVGNFPSLPHMVSFLSFPKIFNHCPSSFRREKDIRFRNKCYSW